ncbi:Peroxidase 2 [Termitomyces sp. J132]|nr:Peroxidase 2 [Termitomyces sp. J132]
MSRPTYIVEGSLVKIQLPPSWRTTVTALTHRPYNQLVACDWQDHGRDIMTSLFTNHWATPNVPMTDITNNDASKLDLRPQIICLDLRIRSYYSKIRYIHGPALLDDQYSSHSARIVAVENPPDTPEQQDSVVFVITVQDETPIGWQPAFDSSIITVRCTYDQRAPSPYNLANIQGDILPGLPKVVQYFYYFVTQDDGFTDIFKSSILPRITSSLKLVSQPTSHDYLGLNVGFTRWYLKEILELPDDLQDQAFYTGQSRDSEYLGDAGRVEFNRWWPDWDDEFSFDNFDGIFIITAVNEAIADNFVQEMEAAFGKSIHKKLLIKGRRRPGHQASSNHFGYRDGISNPEVRGVTFDVQEQSDPRYPGSPIVPLGAIVMGYDGDEDKDRRPGWAVDGAFMVTRKLHTYVPEFEAFLLERGPKYFRDLTEQTAADKLGARLIGRWKDGTPMELSPDRPDPSISGNDERVNNFIFQSFDQTHCPYAAHIRKCSPRNYVSPDESDNSHFIRRHGISFGPEVTDEEQSSGRTLHARGSHFVCYSSSIERGFKHIQCGRSNNTVFPPRKNTAPGMDPIIGETNKDGQNCWMTGADPNNEGRMIIFQTPFVVPRGGEYFFVPSISTLRDYVSTRSQNRH